MKKLLLQPRLQLLYDLVPEGAKLADIGTDHGYLPVALLQAGKIEYAIASDVGSEPLQHARRTAAEYEVKGVDFRLCDGLIGIAPEEVDTIVIAGMGGDTMVSILSGAPWTKKGKLLLLQPMTKSEMLRGWLADNGYRFLKERLVWDKGNLYPVFLIEGGKQEPLTPTQRYGGAAMEDPLEREYLDHQIARLRRSIDGLRKSQDPKSAREADNREVICQALEEKRRSL